MDAPTVARRTVLKGLAGLAAVAPLGARGPAHASSPLGPLSLRGVNLAGAEFGGSLPGELGKDYVYPSPDEIAAYAELGFSAIRVPFRWERLQPEVDGPFVEAEWSEIARVVDDLTARRMFTILDVHNYGVRKIPEDDYADWKQIGDHPVTIESFEHFWAEIARRCKNNLQVVFGLMNEPVSIDPLFWLDAMNRTIFGIRHVGAANLILVPGVNWTGAHSWFGSGNTVLEGLNDPVGNFAIEVHQYVDGNSSGIDPIAIESTIGMERLEAFQEWSRSRGLKAFLGEFGAGEAPVSVAAVRGMLSEMSRNRDVWLGWTAWAGGSWWARDYPFLLDRKADGDWPAQTQLLAAFAADNVAEGEDPARDRWIAHDLASRGWRDVSVEIDFAANEVLGGHSLTDALAFSRNGPALALGRDGRLRSVGADEMRRTDLGLQLDGDGETVLEPFAVDSAILAVGGIMANTSPQKGSSASSLTLGASGIALQSFDGFDDEGLATFSIFASADPRQRLEFEILVDGRRAVFDLGGGGAHAVGADAAASLSKTGDWRRAEMSWQASRRPQLMLSVGRTNTDWVPEQDWSPSVSFWGAVLERGGAATLFDGLRRAADRAELRGRFAAALSGDAATLFIETRNLSAGPTDRPMVSMGDRLLIGRTEDGAVASDFGATLRTSRRPMHRWMARQRTALSFSRREGWVSLATTGESPVSTDATPPEIDAPILLGSLGRQSLNGSVTRIATLTRALNEEEMAAIVA